MTGRRLWVFVVFVVTMAMVAAGCSKTSVDVAVPKATRGPNSLCKGTRAPARYDHVVVVVMENKKWSDVLNGQSPWLTARKNECQTATNYEQAGSPSRPNYIAMVAGSTYGCQGSNADPPGGCTPPSPSLFKQVIDAGGTAKNYLGAAQSSVRHHEQRPVCGEARPLALLHE